MINFYDCNHEQYLKLLDFLLMKCNVMSFCMPNYDTIFRVAGGDNCLSEYERVKNSLKRDGDSFMLYKNNVVQLLDVLCDKIIKIKTNIEYFDQLSNYEKEIFLIKYDSETVNVLKKLPEFKYWLCPDYPEDPYFFSNNQCYFSCVSHENEYSFYDNNDEIIKFVDALGIDFDVVRQGTVLCPVLESLETL